MTEKEVMNSVLYELHKHKMSSSPFSGFASIDPEKVENHVITIVARALKSLNEK